MKKVSIIVPVYNAETYLPNCLESIVNQSYKNIEVILINDGSTDESLKICNSFADRDDRIKVLSIKNSGVSTARNLGIQNASGDYITFVDSDDWIELNMIEFTINKALESNADVIVWSYFKNYVNQEKELSLIPGGNQTFTNEKDILYLKSIYQFYGQQKLSDTVSAGTTWCKLYKTEMIKANGLNFKKELTRSQDVIFCLEAFSKAKLIKYYDKSLYHYRINNSSTCSGTRYIEDTDTPFSSLLNEMERFSGKFNDNKEFQEAINARTVQVILWHLDHKYFHENNKENIFTKRRQIVRLIKSNPYKRAIKNVNMDLLPKKERTAAKLFKYNFILTFYVIYSLHQFYLKLNNKKYE
ncbi:glycosyltransferase [Lederbergia sp. NSJ-179]|uniref:glycosyltransferase n=1 Tax=Lederbergia sp. NSJ-179 TaxID=2931402 RepID=UPI001FD0B29E|nr:glycosyltransferase [Lederbergia sp. NSJ-179]MCJ7840674.1 glycosyltransferase [Lederbergia sp. NSJ-179]